MHKYNPNNANRGTMMGRDNEEQTPLPHKVWSDDDVDTSIFLPQPAYLQVDQYDEIDCVERDEADYESGGACNLTDEVNDIILSSTLSLGLHIDTMSLPTTSTDTSENLHGSTLHSGLEQEEEDVYNVHRPEPVNDRIGYEGDIGTERFFICRPGDYYCSPATPPMPHCPSMLPFSNISTSNIIPVSLMLKQQQFDNCINDICDMSSCSSSDSDADTTGKDFMYKFSKKVKKVIAKHKK
uniref:Uncharacterized protein n=1 Tax=Pasiphaea japonica whispovirus TaxID=2984286 RepID=A0A9C7F109_9VIRU|nr:MAG: hypothetical protein [Pasiphaea japonica whispovirus]